MKYNLEESSITCMLTQLDLSVMAAEDALRRCSWRELGESIAIQRQVTTDLKKTWNADIMSAQEKQFFEQRIGAILIKREGQLKRLRAFHEEVGRRLRQLHHYKFALRKMHRPDDFSTLNVER